MILQAVLADPVSGTIAWADIEALLIAAAARFSKGPDPV